MTQEFIPYEQALALKELGFDEECLSRYLIVTEWENPTGEILLQQIDCMLSDKNLIKAPLKQQAVNWFAENHQIYIGKTGYDDGITPKRFVYHVNDFYVQEQSYDGAIKKAIEILHKENKTMQQTAVEWLYGKSKLRELDKFDLEQAKEMEKQQIKDAYNEGKYSQRL